MKLFARIWFPIAVTAFAAAVAVGPDRSLPGEIRLAAPAGITAEAPDTVKYPTNGWALRRHGATDSLALQMADSLRRLGAEDDSLALDDSGYVHLSARDTIKVPDSLRLTDPWRYRYYVALLDSLTHVEVRDSLMKSFAGKKALGDSLGALADSLDRVRLDSVYVADSASRAKAAFDLWYGSLDRKARKKYDAEQMIPIKMAQMDSLRQAEEDRKAEKDSIIEYTPRILEAYSLPDSLQYKRIIAWTLDQDFHKMDVRVPDTTYNHHFFDDMPYQRKDVNASWLGIPGTPMQYYNFFNRKSDEGVDFYDPLEAWSFSPRTVLQYNSKTPYTELAYFGSLFAKEEKESDNLHIFTTQNITPALNFNLLYNRFGGGGFLANEESLNKTFAAQSNFLGKKYMMHLGYIFNKMNRQENGGVTDRMWVRDTTLEDTRLIPVNFASGTSSTVKKNTVYLDQQFRIPFNFINKIKARKDSSFVFDADSLDKDITTAFLGHSTEYSVYTRRYSDQITDQKGSDFYHGVFNFDPRNSLDSMRVSKLDNKVFLRLQPWSADGVVSKLDVGVGDYLKTYFDSTSVRPTTHRENSMYLYAGAEGQVREFIRWDAKARYVFAGHDFSDFAVEGNAALRFYPFRRARKSPVELGAHFETTLLEPNYYQQHLYTNHFSWDNEFNKTSTTKIEGRLDIPHWKLNATVGYALLANNIFYDTLGIVRQNTAAMSVLSASLRKEFVLGPLHLDNRALLQVSSNQEVLPLPAASFNARWFFQFVVQRNEARTRNIMEMQVGVNAWYNTPWYSPAYNPALGVFHNQNERLYTNGPYFDAFINVQWKRAVIFVKYLNAGAGWPMKKKDFFSADGYVVSSGIDGLKLGIYWPFYTQPGKPHSHSHDARGSSGGGRGGDAGDADAIRSGIPDTGMDRSMGGGLGAPGARNRIGR